VPPPAHDEATPLSEVTFVVLDLETTGGSPHTCAITEVGAVKVRGGVVLGTFETLVNPGVGLPPGIAYLTGITEAMLAPAPRIQSVLPALAEFVGDAVIVGHNVRFDLAFLQANLRRLGYDRLDNASVDTCLLARRLVRDELPDCRLSTVARHLRTETVPNHRAFADALATVELLHRFFEELGTFGVTALDDLLAFPATGASPQRAKLGWVGALPRSPGVHVFVDGRGAVLDVGRATDVRRSVRSYFAGADRRRTAPILRRAHGLHHLACSGDLEARVVEGRLQCRPDRAWYLHLPLAAPRRTRPLRGRDATEDGVLVVGPFAGRAEAKRRSDAVRRAAASTPGTDVLPALRALGRDPHDPDPAAAADAARAVSKAARTQRRVDALVAAGRIEVELDGGIRTVIDGGRLVPSCRSTVPVLAPAFAPSTGGAAAFDEAVLLLSWLETHAGSLRLVAAEHGWAVPVRTPAGPQPRLAGEAAVTRALVA
jgi:DNA polymerase-3 subunit epsilon